MIRLAILMGSLAALVAACGPPSPGIKAEMAHEDELRDEHFNR